MSRNNNYFKVGLFTFVGIGLFFAGLLAFGLSDSLFKRNLTCVTFFNRSVQGLMVDSSVKFRGFNVGKVSSISLASLDEDIDGQPVVKVTFEINPALLVGNDDAVLEARNYITGEIDKGLTVFLSFQGITGIGFLDLDYSEAERHNYFEEMRKRIAAHDIVYVPNGPGQIMEISESATQIVKSLSNVDFSGISKDINTLVKTVEQAVDQIDTARVSDELAGALKEIREAAANLNVLIKDADETIKGGASSNIGQQVEQSMTQLRQTLKRLDQMLGSSQGNLPATLDNLRVMSENLRELSELLKSQPSQLVFGDPPAKVSPKPAKSSERN